MTRVAFSTPIFTQKDLNGKPHVRLDEAFLLAHYGLTPLMYALREMSYGMRPDEHARYEAGEQVYLTCPTMWIDIPDGHFAVLPGSDDPWIRAYRCIAIDQKSHRSALTWNQIRHMPNAVIDLLLERYASEKSWTPEFVVIDGMTLYTWGLHGPMEYPMCHIDSPDAIAALVATYGIVKHDIPASGGCAAYWRYETCDYGEICRQHQGEHVKRRCIALVALHAVMRLKNALVASPQDIRRIDDDASAEADVADHCHGGDACHRG